MTDNRALNKDSIQRNQISESFSQWSTKINIIRSTLKNLLIRIFVKSGEDDLYLAKGVKIAAKYSRFCQDD